MATLRRPKLTLKHRSDVRGQEGKPKIVNIKDKIKSPTKHKKTNKLEGCMKYYYPEPIDMEEKNLPCEERKWPGGDDKFVDVTVYTPKQTYDYVDFYFSNDKFKDDSPFVYQSDFKEKTTEEICDNTSFELKPQQKFLGKFITPETDFPGILVYHKLGSGKTCTSIVIGEAMKSRVIEENNQLSNTIPGRSPFRVYVVVPKSVKEQYYEEIIGKIKDGTIMSCSGSCVITDSEGEGIRQYYVGSFNNETNSYNLSTLNNIRKLESDIDFLKNKEDKTEEDILQYKEIRRKLIEERKNMHNTVDAVYHIISHDTFLNSIMVKDRYTGDYRPTDFLLTDDIFHNKNSLLIIDEIHKLVMEDGTNFNRLYNTLNIYARDRKTGKPTMKVVLLTATPVYDNPFEAAMIINLLRPRIQFPLVREKFNKMFIENSLNENSNMYTSTIKNKNLLQYMLSGYVSYFQGGNPKGYPKRKNIIQIHPMSSYQQGAYNKALVPEILKSVRIHNLDDNNQGIYPISTQICNIAYKYNKDDDEIKSTTEDAKSFYRSLKSKKPEDRMEYIEKHSKKFASIVKLIKKSKGPVFIYSKWVLHGIIGLSLILDALGWKFLTSSNKKGKEYKNYAIWSPGGLEFKGIQGDRYVEEYTKNMRNLFNSPENREGKLCKVLIGNVVEGISLKRVTQVHICEPWWNMSKMEQIIARGIRLCSHADLPKEQQSVDVYYHCSVMNTYPNYNPALVSMLKDHDPRLSYFRDLSRSTMEQKMFISSERKQNINVQFEMTLKKSAVDCYINEEGNIIRLEEVLIPSIKNKSKLIEYNGNYPLYNRSTNEYYIREKPKLLRKLNILNTITVTKLNSDSTLSVHNWPPSGVEMTEEFLELDDWQIDRETGDIIMKENIDCFDKNENFVDLYKESITNGEDRQAWKIAYDSYVKMRLFDRVVVEYDMLESNNPVRLVKCLYNVLKNSERTGVWDSMSLKERKIHKTQLETLLTLPSAIRNKEKLVTELSRKVPGEMKKRLKNYTYAELKGIKERITLIEKLRKKVSSDLRNKLDNYTLEDLKKLERKYR